MGFYGGVNYGFGFGGIAYLGGRWEGGRFVYNSSVANVGIGFPSYHETVLVNEVHTSFNGGADGLSARPTPAQRATMAEHHIGLTAEQNAHRELASRDRSNLVSVNHGRPANPAISRPLAAIGGRGGPGGENKDPGSTAGTEHKAGGTVSDSNEIVHVGQPIDEVRGMLGPPDKTENANGTVIYWYTGLKVTFANGKVSKVQ